MTTPTAQKQRKDSVPRSTTWLQTAYFICE